VIIWHCRDDLLKLEPSLRKRIINKVKTIQNNPYHYVEKLSGFPFYKLRIGDYRVILEIKQDLHVIMVAHRSVVYKKIQR